MMQQFTPPAAILQKGILQPNQIFFEVTPWPLAPHIKDSPHHTLPRVPALRAVRRCLSYISPLQIICNCNSRSQGKSGPPNSSAQNPAEAALLGLRDAATRNNLFFFPPPTRTKRFLQQQHKGRVQGSRPSLNKELVYPENLKLR